MTQDIKEMSTIAVETPSSDYTPSLASELTTAVDVPSRSSLDTNRSPFSSHGSDYTDDTDSIEYITKATPTLNQDAEEEVQRTTRQSVACSRPRPSFASAASRAPDFEVVFEDGDPENPRNWSMGYRAWIIFAVSYSTSVIGQYSTSYTVSMPGLMDDFGSTDTIATLGLTSYLLGLAAGSLIVAPLSELYGRRNVYLICLSIWLVLAGLPCALATSLAEIIAVRFIAAVFGAALFCNSPGTIVDIAHPEYLALCMSLWSIAPLNGPALGPIIGGFVFQYMGWRWCNWIVLIMGGVALILMATIKETYAPAILKAKAARLRQEHDDPRWWCRYDEKIGTWGLIKVNLSRPFVLVATEPILWFLNTWISVIYGILYLCFVAYPIVFSQGRQWEAGMSGLAFAGIGVGTLIAIFCEPLCRRLINSQPRDPATGKVQPEAIALVMAIGAVLTPIGQLGFAWTGLPTSIHWTVPIAFGIPFGAGNTLCFIYCSNYLAGTYSIYAVSALAGNTVLQTVFGATLPLAGSKRYATLSPQWAGTMLGLTEVALIPIPFIFWRYGAKIRAKSPMVRKMREEQDRLDEKKVRKAAKLDTKHQTEKCEV